MTHMSPTALLFCCTCTGAGFLYFTWHSWCFDRFRSLLPTRRQAFKCGITWLMLIAYALFGVWSVGMAYIKYAVGYTNVPTHGSVPTPYRLWPEKYQNVAPLLYYLLVGGFALILSIHIEETCFWIHLARSIQGKTEKTWLGSSWFKLWLGSSLVGAMTLFAVAIPFNDDPQQMETNVLFGGTVFSVIFTIFSFYVILRFPRLIETVRSQGGSQVVLTRLAYHRRLTKYRVFARIIFAVPFLIISVDGLEPHHDVAEHQFLTDLFLFTGLVGLFGSTIISIFIFFPPSDPSIASFAAGDSKRLLTIDQVRTHYDPSPSLPVLANRPDHSRLQPSHMLKHEEATQNGMETGHAQYFMANDSFAKEQIRTQMSMVAPFATPPATPRQSRGLDALGRTGTPPVKDSTRVSRSNTDTSKNSHLAHPETGGTQGGSAYAWGLLADHLKIPETSLGMMREMTEMNKKGWKAARRTAENELFPGVGAHNARSRESSFTRTKRDQEILDSSKMEKEPARPDSFQVLESPPPSAPRSLPPPLRSPPRIHRNFLASDRAELDMPYSATRSSDDILRALQSVRQ